MRSMQGKRALVTGAAGGIGQAIAGRLAREGVQLALLDKNRDRLSGIDWKGPQADSAPLLLECDLSNQDEIQGSIERLVDSWGGLDILINNAGVVFYGKTHKMSQAESDQVLRVNLAGPFELTRLLLPHLLSAPEAHIVNISSVYGYLATNRCSAYHATKYGLIGFSEALRAEYARQQLGVTVLCPGFVQTELFQPMASSEGKFRTPPPWICTTPERVAECVVRSIYRNRRLVLAGWLAHVTYAARRIAPGVFDAMYHLKRPRFLKSTRIMNSQPVAESL